MLTKVDYSDHHPILISLDDASFNRPNKPFKFECAWVLDETYGDMIEEVRNERDDLMTNLDNIKSTYINWNMITVKGTQKENNFLMTRLTGIQKAIKSGIGHKGLTKLETRLQYSSQKILY